MGVKLYAERRYSAKEKENINDEHLKRCNTENAIKAVGFQMDENSDNCKVKKLLDRRGFSSKIRNLIVSTYGTFVIRNGPSNWHNQMALLMRKRKLVPRVLKRELVLILRYVCLK